MFKNWKAICEVSDPALRFLLATTEHAHTLSGLQAGFPSCFSEVKQSGPIPLSVVRTWYRDRLTADQAAHKDVLVVPTDACRHFHIPLLIFGEPNGHPPVPEKYLEKFDDINLRAGFVESRVVAVIEHEGELCVVVDYIGQEFLALAPAKCFSLHG